MAVKITYIHFLSLLLTLSQPRHQILNLRHRAGNQLDTLCVLADLQFSQLRSLSATKVSNKVSKSSIIFQDRHPIGNMRQDWN